MGFSLCVLLVVISGTTLYVKAQTCSVANRFGPQCAYDCHCQVDCDKTSGLCPGASCLAPWSGPTCQRQNAAFFKPTYSSGAFEFNSQWGPDKAVDGNTNQDATANSCYLSSYFQPPGSNIPATNAWMYVDLGQEYRTHNMLFYGRAGFSFRVNGTQLFVSNVANDRANPCYVFNGVPTTGDNVVDLTCDRTGRYVTFYDDTLPTLDAASGTVFLEICEILVFACSPGTYGNLCQHMCVCRNGDTCDFLTGICPNGCLPGYLGVTCNQTCPNGTFGTNCTQSCHCKFPTCDVTTGTCVGGCASGWHGLTCSEVCGDGRWGENCVEECHCLTGTCDPQTGLCAGPCAPGWQGTHCNQACPSGFFGQNCTGTCFCLLSPCNHVTGLCNGACQPGWLSSTCSTPCPLETFGANCSLECHCSGETCNRTTGECAGVCQPGWLGPSCNQTCSAGSFGTNCTGMCRCKDGTCDHVTGLGCQGACVAGFHGDTCSTPCPSNRFGENCATTCRCRTPGCDPLNGTCLVSGCMAGYRGGSCSTECLAGTWGEDCLQACGNCSSACRPRDGTCDTCLPGWSGDRCEVQALQQPDSPEGSGTVVIVGVVVGVIAAVLIVFLIGFFVLRRRRLGGPPSSSKDTFLDLNSHPMKNGSTPSRPSSGSSITAPPRKPRTPSVQSSGPPPATRPPSRPPSTPLSDGGGGGDHETYYNLGGLPRTGEGVPIAELPPLVRQGKLDKRFEAEFENLPTGATFSTIVGQKPENKCRNRFVGYFAYDYNRVKLEPIPGDSQTDYINASYIDSCTVKKAYIASQGPNKHTVGDMWRMLWQQKVEKIVMLTNLFELGKAKCERYWPETGEATFGSFTVRLEEEIVRAPYVIRTLVVSPTKGEGERRIKHFHFTAWPDHGVPQAIELTEFQRRVACHPNPLGGPTVVHCSAGIGRTGSYIAMESLLQNGRRERTVDVHGFACHMRAQRKNMIQTKDQYVFVYDVLVEAFSHENEVMTTREFAESYNSSQPCFGSATLQECHQELMREVEMLRAATAKTSKDPGDEENVYMNKDAECAKEEDVAEDFDPVATPSRTNRRGYYVAKVKGTQNADEFWRLVYETDACMVLSLEGAAQTLSAYMPLEEGQEVAHEHFTVTVTSVKQLDGDVRCTDLKVTSILKKQTESVQHLSVDCSSLRLHGNLHRVTALLKAVQDNALPIVVVFRSWLQGAMLACALRNVGQQARQDKEVDVFSVLRLLQKVVPHRALSLDDAKTCMEFALGCCEPDDNVYANA